MLRGDRVRERRQVIGLSQEELASQAGTDQKRISKYERGESDANGETISHLAKALQTSADYLLGLTDDPTPHLESADLTPNEKHMISAMRHRDYKAIMEIIGEISRT
ncbi:HTH-type transcriptional regulator ImmR [Anaerolineae bacterium]|nr:HTH-type transcriptional regulator ImmR [Anaerolineae bacterium]